MQLGRLDDAFREFEFVLPREPVAGVRVAQLLMLRNLRLEEAKRDWKRVHEILDQAGAKAPKSTEIPVLRARVLRYEGKSAEAQTLLEKARDQQPDRIELWLALLDVVQERKPEKVAELLATAEQRLGDRVELRLARAYLLLAARGDKDAPAALAKLEQDTAKFGSEETRLLRGLAEAYFRAGNTPEARRLWLQVATKEPTDMQVRMTLFDLALQSGDEKALDNLIQEMQTIEGEDGTLWRYSKASRMLVTARKGGLIEQGGRRQGLDKARALLNEAAARRPSWALLVLRQADLDDLEGNQEKALRKYEQAFDLGANSPYALERVLRLLSARRMYTQADRLLAKVQSQAATGTTKEMDQWQAALWSEQGQHENAIALARKRIDQGSKDVRDYVWLGQILSSAKKLQEAEEIFRKALELPGADKTAEPWVVFVQFLARTGQKTKALAVIRQAERKLPEDSATLELAQCYEAVNELGRADQLFKAALDRHPNDLVVLRNVANFHLRTGDLASAEPYLRQILDPQSKATLDDQTWARRGLALRLASTGDYQNFLEAKSLMDENTRGQGDTIGGSPEDQRTKALILWRVPSYQREALRVLEAVVGRQPPTPEEQLILAKLYEAVRDWPKARQVYLLLASHEEKPSYLAECTQALLRHDEVDEAQLFANKLASVAPDSQLTLEIQVRVKKARHEVATATELLQKHSQRKDANLDLCAVLYEEIGQVKEAEAILRRPGQAPRLEQSLMLALFLGRQGRTDEALALCERFWNLSRAEIIGNVCLAILGETKTPTKSQLRRVEKLLKEATDKNPDSPALLLHLAALRDLQQQYDSAMQVYREVLARDPKNVIALNNLAWMMAVRGERVGEALAYVKTAINLVGPKAELRDTLGFIYLASGDTRKAIEEIEGAISEVQRPSYYFHLAQAQFKANNRQAAIMTLREGRSKKLNRSSLHPMEQPVYEQLVTALDEQ
jgi:tetratricopeptide (TPR) repeat protein